MTLLIDYARTEVDMPMRGIHHGYHVGWTIDREKADTMREAGARVTYVPAHDPTFSGWEVSFLVGRER